MKKNILVYLLCILAALALTFPLLINRFSLFQAIFISLGFSIFFSSLVLALYIEIEQKRKSYFEEFKKISNETQVKYEEIIKNHISINEIMYKNIMNNSTEQIISLFTKIQEVLESSTKKNIDNIVEIKDSVKKIPNTLEDGVDELSKKLSKINDKMSFDIQEKLDGYLDNDAKTKVAIQNVMNEYKLTVEIIKKIQDEIITLNHEDIKMMNRLTIQMESKDAKK